MILGFVILILAILLALVMFKAKVAKSKYRELRKLVDDLTVEEAHVRWQAAATRNGDWAGNVSGLTLQRILDGQTGEIEFLPVRLTIGRGNYNAPKVLTDEFQVIGVIGSDDFAWICCRFGNDNIWELDGTEKKEGERNASKFLSLFHYLLFVNSYYEGGKRKST